MKHTLTIAVVNTTDHSRLSHGDIKDRYGTPLKVGDLIQEYLASSWKSV